MGILRGIIVAAAFSCALAAPVHAERQLEVTLMAPVFELGADEAGPFAIVGRGAKHGLRAGSKGSLYEPGAKSGVGAIVARGQLDLVEDAKARFRVREPGPGFDPAKLAGAQVEVVALVPSGVHRGPLFELALLNIVFLDNTKQPLVPLEQILFARDDAVEQLAVAKMITAGHEVIEFTATLKAPTRGPYIGKPIGEILRDAKAPDYQRFLRFVVDYPGKYIGKPWKISETFATWLINDSPLAADERLDELYGLSDRSLRVHLKTLSTNDARTLTDALADRTQNPDAGERGRANLKLLERFVRYRPSGRGKAQLAVARAALLQRERKHAKAAAAYDKAALAWRKAGDEQEALVARNNAANAWYAGQRYDRALRAVKTVRKEVKRAIAKEKDAKQRAHLPVREAFAIQLKARIDEKQGRYREVVEELGPLIEVYANAAYPGARGVALDLLGRVAAAQRKLGELDEARGTYEEMERRAAELNDQRRLAELRWDRADLEYNAGDRAAAETLGREAEAIARAAGDLPQAARALGLQAQALWSLGKLDEAVARHAAGMELREKLGEKSGIAWQAKMVASIQKERGDRAAAEASLRRALGIYDELGRSDDAAQVRVDLAELLVEQKRFDDADAEYQSAAKTFARLKMRPDEARCFEGRAAAAIARKDLGRAAKLLKKAAAAHKRAGAKRSLAGVELWRAWLKLELGDEVAALKAARAASKLARDDGLLADVALLRAQAAQNAGRLAQAVTQADRAMKHAEATGDQQKIIRAHLARYEAHAELALVELAAHDVEQAVALARAGGNKPLLLTALSQRAWGFVSLGRLDEARAAAGEAQEVAKELGDPVELAWLENTLAEVASAYGDLAAARTHYETGIDAMQKAGFAWGETTLRFNRALLLLQLWDAEAAAKELKKVKALRGKRTSAELDVALAFAEAKTQLRLGAPTKAEPLAQRAVKLARKRSPERVPSALGLLARVYEERGKWSKAIPALREAVALERKRNENAFGARAALGTALARKGDAARAEPELRAALARAEKRKGGLPWEPLYRLAEIEAARGKSAEARALLDKAVVEIERGEAAARGEAAVGRYREDKQGAYKLLIELLLAGGEIEAALGYLERAKIAELNEVERVTGGSRIEAQEHKLVAALDAELDKPHPDEARVARLEGLLDQVRKERAAFIESLDQNDALFDRYAVRPLQLEKLQQGLPPGVLVVSPVSLDDKIVIFALTDKVLAHFTSPARADALEGLVAAYLEGLRPPGMTRGIKRKGSKRRAALRSLDEVKQLGVKLYDLLLRQAVDAAPGATKLVVSSSGALRYLPFASLHDGERFVAQRFEVVRMTSLNQGAGAGPAGELTVLAVADPDGSLPGARDEAAALERALGAVTVLTGSEASRAALQRAARRPGYRVLHLATHGRLDADNPHDSHIVLADRKLRYSEIPSLRLPKTRLVVLSACDTAARAGGSGVEIAGLAYQFQRTQVSRVLATLWPVADAETAELMAAFYAQLKAGESEAAALAAAQRAFIEAGGDKAHPAYWAPFLLMAGVD